jgi:hypothetical protein
VPTLTRLEIAIASCWSPETCDPVDRADWSAERPARGQCGATALVVHDHLGGELLVAEVRHEDGSRQGLHYWNRLSGGVEVDLTRAQFDRGEVIGAAMVVSRPPDLTRARLAAQYELLSRRVMQRLS